MFSEAQLQEYRERGYLIARKAIATERLERWNQRFLDLVAGTVERAEKTILVRDILVVKGVVTPETPVHGINKLLGFHDDPVLSEYIVEDVLVSCAEQLLGSDELMSITSNVINKPPGVDSRHPLHQDLTYFPLRPADKIVGVWTAMDPATRENGCLAVVPGSHHGELRSHGDPADWKWVNKAFWAAEGAEIEARVHLEMDPGDTLFFHPLLLHGSGANRSSGFRRAINTHYARADCEHIDSTALRDTFKRLINRRNQGAR